MKSGVVIPAATLLETSPVIALAKAVTTAAKPAAVTPRERLLLDFGWRFHVGHASDAARDFGFSNGRSREFQKTGNRSEERRVGKEC